MCNAHIIYNMYGSHFSWSPNAHVLCTDVAEGGEWANWDDDNNDDEVVGRADKKWRRKNILEL